MPRIPRDAGVSLTGAPAFPFTCSADEEPGRPLPSEYDADGCYAIGPKRARDPLARLIADTICPVTPLSPDKARYEQDERRRTRLRRLAAAVNGQRTRNRRRDAAA